MKIKEQNRGEFALIRIVKQMKNGLKKGMKNIRRDKRIINSLSGRL